MNSSFLKLNIKDFLKGLIVAIISAVLGVISTSLQLGSLTFDWKLIGTIALSAGVAYITKNLFQNSSGDIGTEKK